jgi:hypothetical protein
MSPLHFIFQIHPGLTWILREQMGTMCFQYSLFHFPVNLLPILAYVLSHLNILKAISDETLNSLAIWIYVSFILWFSELWHHAVLWMDINIYLFDSIEYTRNRMQKPTINLGESLILQNGGIHLQYYVLSQPRRPQNECSLSLNLKPTKWWYPPTILCAVTTQKTTKWTLTIVKPETYISVLIFRILHVTNILV